VATSPSRATFTPLCVRSCNFHSPSLFLSFSLPLSLSLSPLPPSISLFVCFRSFFRIETDQTPIVIRNAVGLLRYRLYLRWALIRQVGIAEGPRARTGLTRISFFEMIKECTDEEFRVVLLAAVYWTSRRKNANRCVGITHRWGHGRARRAR